MDQDWICSVKWVQVWGSAEGAWSWTMWLVDGEPPAEPKFTKLAEGTAFNKLGVYWKIWRVCRKHNLRFHPWPWSKTWVSGTIPEKE